MIDKVKKILRAQFVIPAEVYYGIFLEEKHITSVAQQIDQLFPKSPDIEEVKEILNQHYDANFAGLITEEGKGKAKPLIDKMNSLVAKQICQLLPDNPDGYEANPIEYWGNSPVYLEGCEPKPDEGGLLAEDEIKESANQRKVI